MLLGVIETWDGPCAIGYGICRACGWEGVDAFDVGIKRVSELEYEFDEPAEAVCPACSLREVAVDLTIPVRSRGRGSEEING